MSDTVERAIEVLKQGGIILYPTDTIWGIGCDATNEEACQRIIGLKGRSAEKSFVLLVDGFPMIEKFIPEFPQVCYDLADYATRPLTIIYPNAKGLPANVTAEDGSVGIRITTDPTCVKLIRSIRKPLVSTSANISGQPSPARFAEIAPEIISGVDAVVDIRRNEVMKTPSQIIKIGLDSSVKVIRE